MAKFIGSNLEDGNWGEDFFISKLIDYFDDSYIIYRNRMLFGTQFDVCMLIPTIGVVVFEVKGWKPETILRVENGDRIWIKDVDNGETEQDPTGQARGYMFNMSAKIRQKTGKKPLVFSMVCFPQIDVATYKEKGLETVCEYETTILKEDLLSKASLYNKINLAMRNCARRATYRSKFDDDLMFRIRQIFENDLKKEDVNCTNTNIVDGASILNDTPYSYFVTAPKNCSSKEQVIEKIVNLYSSGTKVYAISNQIEDIVSIGKRIDAALTNKGIKREKSSLKIDFEGTAKHFPLVNDMKRGYSAFNISIVYYVEELKFVEAIDGKFSNQQEVDYVKRISKSCEFNFEQFEIEHADFMKNILVKAGAGTGKTYTMISRISFICHMQKCSLREMLDRIVMITFTNEAAENMEKKIREYFNNFYLLTNNTECLAFISQIDKMQISTIHSYAKKMIGLLGVDLGYGCDVAITSGEYRRKVLVLEKLNQYLTEKQQKYGEDYISKIGMPVYALQNNIINFINILHNQSIDIPAIEPASFGEIDNASNNSNLLHELLATIIPEVEFEYNRQLREENKVHLSSMMSLLKKCLSLDSNVKRLKQMQSGRPQFMFVDEFQDTDDTQIEALLTISELMEYKLFVVGDIKQCIYRFRGAKEKAFDQLHYEEASDRWSSYSLNRNYRTDSQLLDIFDISFSDWGKRTANNDPLLEYKSNGESDKDTDRLVGMKKYNSGVAKKEFYKKITISEENERMSALFEEVNRQKARIEERISSATRKGEILDEAQRDIAILVRENWQADIIRKEGRKRNIQVVTNTGGDLYMSEPAIDLLKLANALVHYDEADYLYSFVASNFISGEPSKAMMYQIRVNEKSSWKRKKTEDTSQSKELLKLINTQLSSRVAINPPSWNQIVLSIRTRPILQVLRTVYAILKPWENYGNGDYRQEVYYKENVDLLFEEIISSSNSESLSLHALVDILNINIITQKNVDSRVPEHKSNDVVVRCVTVHKSKGLEYGSVILPYCSFAMDHMKRVDLNVSTHHRNNGVEIGYQIKVPERNEKIQNSYFDENVERDERKREETRILYVAMTRAIETFSWIVLRDKKSVSWQDLICDGGFEDAL